MLRKLLICLALVFTGSPALATDWLIQPPDSDVCTTIWKGPNGCAPHPGFNCPPYSTWAIFIPVNGDVYPGHYIANKDHTLTYIDPTPPPETP